MVLCFKSKKSTCLWRFPYFSLCLLGVHIALCCFGINHTFSIEAYYSFLPLLTLLCGFCYSSQLVWVYGCSFLGFHFGLGCIFVLKFISKNNPWWTWMPITLITLRMGFCSCMDDWCCPIVSLINHQSMSFC